MDTNLARPWPKQNFSKWVFVNLLNPVYSPYQWYTHFRPKSLVWFGCSAVFQMACYFVNQISSGTHIYQKFYLIFEVYAWVVKEDHLCSSDKRLMGCWFDEGQAGLEMHREFAVK